jgi:hypothetical protein
MRTGVGHVHLVETEICEVGCSRQSNRLDHIESKTWAAVKDSTRFNRHTSLPITPMQAMAGTRADMIRFGKEEV